MYTSQYFICIWMLIRMMNMINTTEENEIDNKLPLKIASFSGNGYILNKLTNRPITSTEERIQIDLQTKQSNSSLFCAGSETQLLRLDIVNGQLKVFLHLPITETDVQSNSVNGDDATIRNPYIYQKNKLSTLFQLDILIQSKLDPALRLDDNQWHTIILSRSNSVLQVFIDNDLVFTRLLGSTNHQHVYLLHTQVLVLGGPYKLGDIFQMNSVNTVSDNNFIGFISKAIFQADSLEMNILEFTLSNLHGFRIQSTIPLTNKISHQNETSLSTIKDEIQFITICDLINSMNQMESLLLSSELFLTLKLPTFSIINLLQQSIPCIEQNNNNLMKWINLEIDFNQYFNEPNSLLFLLHDDTNRRIKHFTTINSNTHNDYVTKENVIGNFLISAEFRNHILYIIIQKSKQIWINVKLNSSLVNSHNVHKLHIKYTMIGLATNDNQSTIVIWPLVKIQYDKIDKLITIGPINNQLTILNDNEELKLLQNVQIFDHNYQTIWQNTLWFGRTLYLGGIDYASAIESGLYIPGIQNINGLRQRFHGCITRLTVNGLRLDLQSAIQSRIRYLQSVNQQTIRTNNSFPLKCQFNNNNVIQTKKLFNICSSTNTSKLSYSLSKIYHQRWRMLSLCLRNSSTTFNVNEYHYNTPILHFNGLQLIRIQFPVQQYSSLLWIIFIFQTNQLNGTILCTASNSQYAVHIVDMLTAINVEKRRLSIDDRKKFSSSIQQHQKIHNEYYVTNYDDHFQIIHVNGHIHVKYYINGKEEIFKVPVFISDGKWHYFELIHNTSHVTIHLDENTLNQRTNLTITELPIQQITIGLSTVYESSSFLINSQTTHYNSGYNGEIVQFAYNGLELLPYNKHIPPNQNHLENIIEFPLNKWIVEFNVQLLFEYPKEIKSATYDFPIKFKQSDCYLSMINDHFEHVPFSVKFSFKTLNDQGLLLFVLNKENDDFLLVELFNGQILCTIHINNELITVTPSMNKDILFNDLQWHTVELFRSSKEKDTMILRTDDQTPVETFTNIHLSKLFNFEQSISNSMINIGGCSVSDYIKFKSKINSKSGFQGCIANFQLNNQQSTINLLQSTEIHPNNQCIDHIVYGCESKISECTWLQNNQDDIYQFQLNFHDYEFNNEIKNMPICYNNGKCMNRLNTFYCACDLTTFQGYRCDEVGTTLHFGKTTSISNSHLLNQNDTLINTKPTTGFVQFQIFEYTAIPKLLNNEQYTINNVFTLGIQFDIPVLYHTEKLKLPNNDIVTLVYAENRYEYNLTYFHVYLEYGYLKMKFQLDGSMIVIDGPKINVQDGYYHRIRGIRARNQILLEVDQHQTVYRLYNDLNSLLKAQYIWLGHSPLSNHSDFIHGYITGVYYNGLQLTELASGLKHLSFVKVTRYAEVEHTNTFQLKLGPNSPLYVNSNQRRQNKQSPLKTLSKLVKQFTISTDFMPNLNLTNSKINKCLSCTNENSLSWNQSPLSMSLSPITQSDIQVQMIPLTKSINIWLFICLIVTGLIVISSFSFLIYRCIQHRIIDKHNNHYTQPITTNSLSTNQIVTLKSHKNNQQIEHLHHSNVSFHQLRYPIENTYELNSTEVLPLFPDSNQYLNDKFNTIPSSIYVNNNETLLNLNDT
ncbi:Neurexin-2 isoform 1 [Schistosoma japonicum]|uniref:Neurexin-2 isoform 1 n=2 Tax=Schistosoma japonicum TaxID=6182 RepID=A0A4Z2CW60_SCHJA|nr:Neurexin-2 isoform 1 [Schistosoma japonicum]